MQQNYNKKRKLNKLKASLLLLMLVCFAGSATAQTRANDIRMKTGNEVITDAVVYNFYDSGGPHIVPLEDDPNNDYNWVTMYQHNESYLLHFVKPSGYDTKGIKVIFNYLLVNDDHLKIYEGDLELPEKLIVDLTSNDYSTGYGTGFTVISHGNMTLRFTSNSQYRDLGWVAQVELFNYAPQAPVALMSACDNLIELLPGSMSENGLANTKMYYTTDGSTPLYDINTQSITVGTLYTDPFPITQATTVKAILVENNNSSSSVSTYEFNSLISPPATPTITRVDGTNDFEIDAHWNSGLRDTYYIQYTTDGTDPRYAPDNQHLVCSYRDDEGTYHNKINTVTMNGTGTLRVVTRGTTCPDLFSEEASVTVDQIFVPTPVIDVTGTGNTGSATITCSLSGVTIYYTLDGSDPTTSTTTSGNSPVNLTGIAAGTTIKAMAAHEGTGYVASGIASAIYIPGGQGGQGVYGSVVLLDDREDHSWSYYSDNTNPIRSLNPADVKITYFGNGTNTVATSSNANPGNTFTASTNNSVQVSYNETANQFVYLKTLERADGATSTNPTGNCAYTTIPNPFSKRPTNGTGDTRWRGFYGWRVKAVRGGSIQNYAVGATIPAETEIQFVPAGEYGMEVELEALWARAYVVDGNNNTYVTITDQNVGYERNFVILRGNNDYRYSRLTNTGYPVTVTAIFPNGTSDGTTQATQVPTNARFRSGFDCAADIKIEYIRLNNNNTNTLTANNHNLIIGRGVTGYNNGTCATLVRGMGGNSTSNVNYTIRLESGVFGDVAFIYGLAGADAQNNITLSGSNNHITGVLGCDYDRAIEKQTANYNYNTAPLRVTNRMSLGADVVWSNQGETEVFNATVKSGYFGSGNSVGDGSAARAFYIGIANDYNIGKRKLTLEGGNLNISIAGGIDENNTSNDAVIIRMKGGTVAGSVYGAAAHAAATGGRRFIFTGGTVNGWIAGGCNGTQTTGGKLTGSTFIYFGGNAKCDSNGSSTTIGPGQATGGNIFGAGSGNASATQTATVGEVDNSTIVIADNAEIERSVYGGGNYGYVANGTGHKSDIYVLGGTVKQSVFGGANMQKGQIVNIWVKEGTVQGNVYGGSNTQGTVNGLATINMSGGTVNNVYGGGYGTGTTMAQNTLINVTGGTINNNVYGGGALGTVTGNTIVTVSGGEMKNIFGAGQGRAAATGVTAVTANIGGTTTVNVNGGTIAESVYGGGEIGNVKQASNPSKGEEGIMADPAPVSTVNITDGTISGYVFGGGKEGYTNGGTLVNMSGGLVEGSVFGGALGLKDKVYVAGLRVVNMLGGTVNKHVYGGSRNADDALTFSPGSFASSNETRTASVVNFAGGYVHYQVFASGYFGKVFGSTYAFVGTNAILNAPNHVYDNTETNRTFFNAHLALRIGGSVWAGGDFGNYDGSKFGDPTISGHSNVYIDGEGYDTESNNTTATNFMNIGGSVYGSGTSCDAGKQNRNIIIRNYGVLIEASQATDALPYSSATRALYSVQRAKNLDIDNSHIVFLGEGKVNSLVTTEKYTIHEFEHVRLDNGSSIFLNYPADQLKKFGSYHVDDVYATSPTYTKVTYETSSLEATPNKVRVNNGAYIQIKYVDDQNVTQYGELEGFAYMMSDDANNTCAYARPKQSTEQGNIIPNAYDNPNDGGWVSYDETLNDYTIGGAPATGGSSDQMRYENHTVNLRNGEQYFRIWRAGGTFSYREGVFVAQSDGTSNYSTVDVHIDLPAFENCSEGTGYYRIKTLDGNTTIDYGDDVMMVNAACYGNVGDEEWMYIDGVNATSSYVTELDSTDATLKANGLKYIKENPNVNFGLVALPQGGLAGSIDLGTEEEPNVVTNENMLICETSDAKVSTMKWYNTHNETAPQVTFRLTFNNNLTNNVVWDPITITFEQVDCSGNVAATVDVALTVTTLTSINQDFVTQAYAIVRGSGTGTGSYNAKIVLPQYVMHVNTVGDISDWTCESVTFEPKTGYSDDLFVGGTNYLNPSQNVHNECNNKFGMTLVAGLNFDNTTGWDFYPLDQKNMYNWTDTDYIFGQTTARDPIGFDFTLLYDDRQKASGNYQVGTLNFKMKFTNYENAPGGDPYSATLNIKIEIWFLGQGANYYIDGVNGNNLYSGKYPNAAKKSLSGIYNRTDYHPGDYIFVVDQVTANEASLLSWNGKAYDGVTLYRYPGGHECVPNETGAESHYTDYNIATNATYTGPLVVVEKNMEMTGIVLDGFYEESQKEVGTAAGDITGHYHTYQPSAAPLVEIKNGGRLTVYGSSSLEHNYNSTTDGGGVYVQNGGVFNLYDGSAVKDNYVSTSKNGGGIYVNNTSKVQLSDEVNITGNQQISGSKADEGTDNNVYLSTYDSHVDVGTVDTDDAFIPLLSTSRVGITKVANSSWEDHWYAPVAFSDGGQQYLGDLISSDIMWDDQHRYDIVSLNNTHYSEPLNYVYFVGTWVTEVTENPQNPTEPNNFDLTQIDTPYELAWLISYVNGLNGATAHPNAIATLTGDIDMSANIWVPITNYTGKFNGNGHVVTGLRSPLNSEHMGMFGATNGATISDLVAQANFAGGNMRSVGTVIGTMDGGTLSNVEAAGTLTGTNTTAYMGGLVGEVLDGTIHSSFGVNTITGGSSTTYVGGLVGANRGDLYNSYSNAVLNSNGIVGGLVGMNFGNIENCYNATETTYAFAGDNVDGESIKYCYAAHDVTSFVGGTPVVQPTGHGNYGTVLDRKALGYMYGDNAVTLVEDEENPYVAEELSYNGHNIDKWPGLLSTLNQWVIANPKGLNPKPTTWYRSNSSYKDSETVKAYINDDLPVLGFPSDNSLATEDGKFLYYGSNVNANGLDNLFTVYDGKTANMFLYGNATNVTLGNGNNMLFINEDAVLLQSGSNAINATVGVTFDNSDHGQNAYDYYGNQLLYDWHFMSTPLSNAPTGATYGQENGNHGNVNLSNMTNGYFPNELTPMDGAVKWDFYTYYEPEYHWINLKRTDHFHMDGGDPIEYNEDDNKTEGATFVPGKGYMMAISQDSYMSNSGVLNNGSVTITLTNQEPDDLQYNKGWNLVGNPYQAYLDLNKVGAGTYYIYDAESGNYVPYAVQGSENPVTPSRYIHPHQGFFMYAEPEAPATTETFTFTPGMATTEKANGSYFRGDEQINYPLVNLFARNQAGNNDLTIIEFNRPEIGGATKVSFMSNANFQIAAHLDGQNYGLLFTPENTEKVPVRFYTDEDGTFTLTWSTFNGDFTSLLLVDNMTGTITDMLRSDHYTFDAKTSDYASRFYLTYACTGVEEVNEGDGSFAFFDGSEWVVNGKGQLDIIDVTGRVLFSKRIANEQNRVNLNNVAPGVYMMRVSDGKDTMVQKIVVR